jgi:hypothetical protein
MGRIGRIKEINDIEVHGDQAVELQINLNGGQVVTIPQFSNAGIDSKPCTDDYVVITDTVGDSGFAVVGYLDRQNVSGSKNGEIRIVGRGSSGNEMCQIHLEQDGSITVSNDLASISMDAAGTIEAKTGPGSIKMDVAGNIFITSGPGSIVMTPAGLVTINGKLAIAP